MRPLGRSVLTVVIVAVLVVVSVVVTVTVGSGSHSVVVTVEGREGLLVVGAGVHVLDVEVLLCVVCVESQSREPCRSSWGLATAKTASETDTRRGMSKRMMRTERTCRLNGGFTRVVSGCSSVRETRRE